ncbi:MAG TPA: T9SS type A sorting domain-containing protein, partial [Ignavibacteriaceae bacterium]|nr:T9SS type A sorting domain-containing protein [Ignavibacteriaceae bacterium]
SDKADNDVNLTLPPPPPPSVLDARFATGRIAEDLTQPRRIVINSTVYPVRIKVDGMDISVKDTKGGKIINGSVRSGDYIVISDPSVKEILVSRFEMPTEFDMMQNYPNPFNPSTMIKFALPVDAKVTVRVYDMVGQEVTQLISEQLTAGYHQVEFNANQLSSGVYFYRIDAIGLNGKDYSSVKKMMLLK